MHHFTWVIGKDCFLAMSVNATVIVKTGESFTALGAYEVGSNVSLVLSGALFVQAYFYFEHYPNDRLGYKALVYAVL